MKFRIKKIRSEFGLTQSEFAERLHMSRNFIAQIETGARVPSDRTIADICREFSISREWLETGQGTMKAPLPKQRELAALVESICSNQDDIVVNSCTAFLESYFSLSSADDRAVVREMIDKMLGRIKDD